LFVTCKNPGIRLCFQCIGLKSRSFPFSNAMSALNSALKLPTFFLSHGGGPWPWVPQMRQMFAKTERELSALPRKLAKQPKAMLFISGHWEAANFTVSTAAHPPMEYDYSGFPDDTYKISYPAPGAPKLAEDIRAALAQAGIACGEDPRRGFDHGVFVPAALMYPEANIPIVMLSLKSGYDPEQHLAVGRALAPLREQGVLIVGSGLTYHNMRGFGQRGSAAPATAFETALTAIISDKDAQERDRRLVAWETAPAARLAHPREDHLIPLMVIAGAAGNDVGFQVFGDHAMEVPMASYQFG